MKGWVILILAVVGGYVVLQWFTGQRNSPAGGSAVNPPGGGGTGAQLPLAATTGVGDFFVSPLASGVPTFNDLQIANGHGDQVAAAYHSNSLSTLNGSAVYEPAFGPVTNQNGPGSVYLLG